MNITIRTDDPNQALEKIAELRDRKLYKEIIQVAGILRQKFPDHKDKFGHRAWNKELVRALLALRRWEEAQAVIDALPADEKNQNWPHTFLGRAYQAAQRWDEARAEWLAVLSMAPNHHEAKLSLNRITQRLSSQTPQDKSRNVFILCTGRCGSTTLIRACRHISNYTAKHESRSALLGNARFDYPANHIEADNRLSWLLGRLDREYGKDALYVHLTRETGSVAASYAQRYGSGIMRAYRGGGIIMGLPGDADPMDVALDYCDTVDSNIKLFLRDKPRKMDFRLESAQEDFLKFCEFIKAEVALDKALAELAIQHNATKPAPRKAKPA